VSTGTSKHEKPVPDGDTGGESPGIDRIEADIAQTRHELGETVDALSAKLDVKARARTQLDRTRRRALEQVDAARSRLVDAGTRARNAATQGDGSIQPFVPAGAVVLVVAGVTVLLWRRRAR
jgi:hypothetical protein